MNKSWTPFLKNVVSMVSSVRDVNGKYLENDNQLLSFTPSLQPSKRFIFLNIPEGLEEDFRRRFIGDRKFSIPGKTVGRILGVREYNNFREALISMPLALYRNTSYRRYLESFPGAKMRPQCYIYLAVDAEHPMYNFIDPGNFIYTAFLMDDSGRMFTKIGKTGDAYQYISIFNSSVKIDEILDQFIQAPYKAKLREVSELYQGAGNNPATVMLRGSNIAARYITSSCLFDVDYRTENDLKSITRTELLQLSKIQESQDSTNQLLLNLTTLKEGGEIKLPSDLVIKHDRVTYSGQELYSSRVTPEQFLFNAKICFPNFNIERPDQKYIFTPLLKRFTVDEINWDNYLEGFVKYQWIIATKKPGPIKLRIGTVDLTLEYKPDKKFFYINDKRINKEEIPEVLTKALCSRTNEDYAVVLGIIAKTSLEMHRLISEGLNIRLNIHSFPKEWNVDHIAKDIKDSYCDVSFKIAREKNVNYIELDKKFVRINNTRALHDVNKQVVPYTRIQEIFGEGTKVLDEPIDVLKDIAAILEKARERYLAAFKKSQLLLKDAVEELGGKIMDWKGKKGVYLKGMSGTEYFIQASNIDDPLKGEPECGVYHYPSGRYICIVDKYGGGSQAGVDRLVARMYALKNDSVLAEHIHTLASYVKN